MEKEILYKIVLDWYNATVVGADGYDPERAAIMWEYYEHLQEQE